VLVFLVLVVIYRGYAVWMSFQRIVLFAAIIVVFVVSNFGDALRDGDFWCLLG